MKLESLMCTVWKKINSSKRRLLMTKMRLIGVIWHTKKYDKHRPTCLGFEPVIIEFDALFWFHSKGDVICSLDKNRMHSIHQLTEKQNPLTSHTYIYIYLKFHATFLSMANLTVASQWCWNFQTDDTLISDKIKIHT